MRSNFFFLGYLLITSSIFSANDVNISVVNVENIKVPRPVKPPKIYYFQDKSTQKELKIKAKEKLHFPPHYNETENDISMAQEDRQAGDVKDGYVSIYLSIPYSDIATFTKTLQKAGFIELGMVQESNTTSYMTIIFSSKELIEHNSSYNQGFDVLLYAFISNQEKKIFLLNPRYQFKYMMQERYDERLAQSVLGKLRSVFTLQDDVQKVKFIDLVHDTNALHEQIQTIAIQNTNQELLQQIQNLTTRFSIQFPNKSYVIGIYNGSQNMRIHTTIEGNVSLIFPCVVLLENGQAEILKAPFYCTFFGTQEVNEECSTIFR